MCMYLIHVCVHINVFLDGKPEGISSLLHWSPWQPPQKTQRYFDEANTREYLYFCKSQITTKHCVCSGICAWLDGFGSFNTGLKGFCDGVFLRLVSYRNNTVCSSTPHGNFGIHYSFQLSLAVARKWRWVHVNFHEKGQRSGERRFRIVLLLRKWQL